MLNTHRTLIAQIGGVVVVILGLHMMGMIRIPFLMMDKRAHVQRQDRRSLWTSLRRRDGVRRRLVAVHRPDSWREFSRSRRSSATAKPALLLAVYSLGLAVPFLVTAVAIGAVLPAARRGSSGSCRRSSLRPARFLIVVGLVLVNNAFLNVAGWFYQFVPQPKL